MLWYEYNGKDIPMYDPEQYHKDDRHGIHRNPYD